MELRKVLADMLEKLEYTNYMGTIIPPVNYPTHNWNAMLNGKPVDKINYVASNKEAIERIAADLASGDICPSNTVSIDAIASVLLKDKTEEGDGKYHYYNKDLEVYFRDLTTDVKVLSWFVYNLQKVWGEVKHANAGDKRLCDIDLSQAQADGFRGVVSAEPPLIKISVNGKDLGPTVYKLRRGKAWLPNSRTRYLDPSQRKWFKLVR